MENKLRKIGKDVTPGMLYDGLVAGKEYYDAGHRRILINEKGMAESANLLWGGILQALEDNNIYELIGWEKALDGTWENGTWCLCEDGDEPENKSVSKVLLKQSNGTCPYTDHNGSHWPEVTPLDEKLAESLESLFS